MLHYIGNIISNILTFLLHSLADPRIVHAYTHMYANVRPSLMIEKLRKAIGAQTAQRRALELDMRFIRDA